MDLRSCCDLSNNRKPFKVAASGSATLLQDADRPLSANYPCLVVGCVENPVAITNVRQTGDFGQQPLDRRKTLSPTPSGDYRVFSDSVRRAVDDQKRSGHFRPITDASARIWLSRKQPTIAQGPSLIVIRMEPDNVFSRAAFNVLSCC